MTASPEGLDAISASDTWLDQIGRGQPPAGDALAAVLSDWLTELDSDYRPAPTVAPRPRLRTRRSAAAAAAVMALLAGAGTAAASPGNPVHRIFFGHQTSAVNFGNPRLTQAARLLDAAERLIRRGQASGYLAGTSRAAANSLLTQSQDQMQPLPASPDKTALTARKSALATQLAALSSAAPEPTLPTPSTIRHPHAAAPPHSSSPGYHGQPGAGGSSGGQAFASTTPPPTDGGTTDADQQDPSSVLSSAPADSGQDSSSTTQSNPPPERNWP